MSTNRLFVLFVVLVLLVGTASLTIHIETAATANESDTNIAVDVIAKVNQYTLAPIATSRSMASPCRWLTFCKGPTPTATPPSPGSVCRWATFCKSPTPTPK